MRNCIFYIIFFVAFVVFAWSVIAEEPPPEPTSTKVLHITKTAVITQQPTVTHTNEPTNTCQPTAPTATFTATVATPTKTITPTVTIQPTVTPQTPVPYCHCHFNGSILCTFVYQNVRYHYLGDCPEFVP